MKYVHGRITLMFLYERGRHDKEVTCHSVFIYLYDRHFFVELFTSLLMLCIPGLNVYQELIFKCLRAIRPVHIGDLRAVA